MKNILLTCLLLCCLGLRGQGVFDWTIARPGPESWGGRDVLELKRGQGYLVLMSTSLGLIHDSTFASIGVVDTSGNLVWERTYKEYAPHFLFDFTPLRDGGYVLVGLTWSDLIGPEYWCMALLRTDAVGNMLWERCVIGPSPGGELTGVVEMEGGDLIVCGQGIEYRGLDSPFFIARLTPEGDTVWTGVYGSPHINRPVAVRACPDGGFLMYGRSQIDGGENLSYYLKFTENGDTLWSRQYMKPVGASTTASIDMVVAEDNSGYYACAKTYLQKVNLNGELLWQKVITHQSLCATRDGGVVLSSKILVPNPPGVTVTKYDGDGNLLWKQDYFTEADDLYFAIRETGDGGLILSGTTPAPGYDGHLKLLKLNCEGLPVAHDSACQRVPPPVVPPPLTVEVYPSPVRAGAAAVVQGLPAGENLRLWLYDALGKRIWNGLQLAEGYNALPVEGLAAGVYMYVVEGALAQRGKLVIGD